MRRLIQPLMVAAALAIGASAAQAQYNPYQSAPPPVVFDTGNGFFGPPVAIGPYGVQPLRPTGPNGGYYTYSNGYYDEFGNPIPTSGYRSGFNNVGFGPNDIPRTTESIEARRLSGNRLEVSWKGEPRAVSRITFALLDRSKDVIARRTITAPPAQARFTRGNRAAYYRVTVEYINGTTSTVTSPL